MNWRKLSLQTQICFRRNVFKKAENELLPNSLKQIKPNGALSNFLSLCQNEVLKSKYRFIKIQLMMK